MFAVNSNMQTADITSLLAPAEKSSHFAFIREARGKCRKYWRPRRQASVLAGVLIRNCLVSKRCLRGRIRHRMAPVNVRGGLQYDGSQAPERQKCGGHRVVSGL